MPEHVRVAGKRRAEQGAKAGDPPLRRVLDELANSDQMTSYGGDADHGQKQDP
jgi:hypothetical protein